MAVVTKEKSPVWNTSQVTTGCGAATTIFGGLSRRGQKPLSS
jgi:hypothetical protein